MIKQLEVFLVSSFFIFISAIILIIYTFQREQEFKDHNAFIKQSIIDGAAYAIKLQIESKQRHVRLFADEYSYLLDRLNGPYNEKVENDVKFRLKERFPDVFTYTVTNKQGTPLLFDIESDVGEVCKNDITKYIKRLHQKNNQYHIDNKVFIHPQPEHYHYDVMAPLAFNKGIFFVSFYLGKISEILKTHEIPGHQLIIIRQSDKSLIEVTSSGARSKISRDIRLSPKERRQLGYTKKITNTDWQVAILSDPDFFKKYQYSIWKEAGLILLIEVLFILALLFFLPKIINRR